MRLIRELHRRSLWQVLAIYVAASWAVLEAADVLIERLSLPEWIYGLAIILLLIGLPIVLGTAFIQESDTPSERSLPRASVPGRLLTWRNAAFGGLGASFLWAVIVGGWLVFGGNGTGAEASAGESSLEVERSVAVLPFTNMSGDEENEYFSDGITEEILNALAQLPDLRVPGRTSSFSFKNTDLRISQIADTLGVTHVLEGSVRKSGNRVRITAQLVDARHDEHLWSETYDRGLEDVFAVQTEIARAISAALEIRLGREDETRLADGGTGSPEAHDQYLRGRHFWNQRTARSLRRAAEHFGRALELDSTYAEAWSGLADTYSVMSFYAYMDTVALDLADLRERALAAARRAVELGPDMAASRTSLAYAHFFDGNWEDAEREFRRAIELNPGYATARHWYGEFLAYTGRAEEGIPHSRRAVELDPISKIMHRDYAHVLLLAGRDGEAVRQARHTVELDPSWAHGVGHLARALFETGRYDESLEQILEGARLAGADTAGFRQVHRCLVRHRETGESRRCVPRPEGETEFFQEGRKEEGLRALERRIRSGNFDYRTLALLHENWGSSDLLRDDPRYRELVEEIGITW